jgi:hypothetical protein
VRAGSLECTEQVRQVLPCRDRLEAGTVGDGEGHRNRLIKPAELVGLL